MGAVWGETRIGHEAACAGPAVRAGTRWALQTWWRQTPGPCGHLLQNGRLQGPAAKVRVIPEVDGPET